MGAGRGGPDEPLDHVWVDDACLACGLCRSETWLLDAQDRQVMALVWSEPSGRPLRIRPFPLMLGLEPPKPPTQVLAEAFPGITVGREPDCRPGSRSSAV